VTTTTRPVVFVGSSAEGLPVARALQQNLDHDAEVILWSQGVFGVSDGTLQTLVDTAQRFDFAVLVLTPDDLILSKDETKPSPRDNVVFELGLFMGALGRERTYIVHNRTAGMRLPSDLAGVTCATYEPPQAGSYQSALGAPSSAILAAIQGLGARHRTSDEVYIDQSTQFKVVAGLLDVAELQIFILMHETGSILWRQQRFSPGSLLEYYVRSEHHQSSGYIRFEVDAFCTKLADAELLTVDLRGRICLSERGHAFADWLVASGYRAQYFRCDIGTWGVRSDWVREMPPPADEHREMVEPQGRQAAEKAKPVQTDPVEAEPEGDREA
jgi:hypothetical protein